MMIMPASAPKVERRATRCYDASRMPLVTLDRVSMAYGHLPLLHEASLRIDSRERVCVIGRNGTGKSTLLQIVGGDLLPQQGDVRHEPGLRIGRLAQDALSADERRAFDVVAEAYGDARVDRWRAEQRVEMALSRFQISPDVSMSTLSGGWRRRVLLARALVTEPDLLLLDEPTNHLDIETMRWLEGFLADYEGTVLFVTHDRAFLQAASDPYCRTGSRPAHVLARRLRDVPPAQRRISRHRSRASRQVRQAACRRGGVAAPGHQGTPDEK